MHRSSFFISLGLAVLIGVAQLYFIGYCLAYLTAYVPAASWLHSIGLRGPLLYGVVLVFEALLNLVLCVPGAFALYLLKPRRTYVYVLAAVLPAFVWQFLDVFRNTAGLSYWEFYLPGAALALFALPVTVYIFGRVVGERVA